MEFLKNLLEYNGLEVRFSEEAAVEDASGVRTYTIGVTDLVFNPVFAIYERRLKTPDGNYVTPAIWKQETTEFHPDYWMEGRRKNGHNDDAAMEVTLDPFGPLK